MVVMTYLNRELDSRILQTFNVLLHSGAFENTVVFFFFFSF